MNILWIEDGDRKKIRETMFPEKLLKDYHCRIDESFDNCTECDSANGKAERYYALVIFDINLKELHPCDLSKKFAEKFGKSEKEFLEKAGLDLYLKLIPQGFDKKKIIFLTGNTAPNEIASQRRRLEKAISDQDSDVIGEYLYKIHNSIDDEESRKLQEIIDSKLSKDEKYSALLEVVKIFEERRTKGSNNSYEQFRNEFKEIHLDAPDAFYKEDKKNDLDIWFQSRLNSKSEEYRYTALRRGVIMAVDFLKEELSKSNALEDYLIFNKTLDREEDSFNFTQERQYFLAYLDKFKDFFPLNPPKDRKTLYYRFIRELSAEWDRSRGYFDKEFKYSFKKDDIKFNFLEFTQSQMKLARNLTAHFKIDENQLDERAAAYFFMVAMRALFNLDSGKIYEYEQYFENLYENRKKEVKLDDTIKKEIALSYRKLRNHRELKFNNPKGNTFLNMIETCTRPDDENKRKDIKKMSLKLLYQNYFHTLFPASMVVGKNVGKANVAMFVNFDFQELPKETFISYLAGLIHPLAFKA